jgi:hypothetical protein
MWALLRSPRRLVLTLRVLAFAAVTPIVVRLPPSWLGTVLEPRRPRPAAAPEALASTADVVDRVLAKTRRTVGRSCFSRGVTQYYFLRRAGADVRLAFGVGKPEGEFAGHCWLVKDGEPFLEKTDPRPVFAEIWSIEPGR